jgi:hypothetical protein
MRFRESRTGRGTHYRCKALKAPSRGSQHSSNRVLILFFGRTDGRWRVKYPRLGSFAAFEYVGRHTQWSLESFGYMREPRPTNFAAFEHGERHTHNGLWKRFGDMREPRPTNSAAFEHTVGGHTVVFGKRFRDRGSLALANYAPCVVHRRFSARLKRRRRLGTTPKAK